MNSQIFYMSEQLAAQQVPGGNRQAMSSGFNTDVRVGDQVFHVQTEDRGPSHPVIDTVVYQHGRVLHRQVVELRGICWHRRNSRAEGVAPASGASSTERVIEDLAIGRAMRPKSLRRLPSTRRATGGIQVQLLNPTSWLTGGNVSLDVEILRRADQQPQAGAQVEAAIEGACRRSHHAGTSDDQGRVRIEFPAAAARKRRSGAGDSRASGCRQGRDSLRDALARESRQSRVRDDVTINGERREIPDGLNVAALLEHLGMPTGRVAIERNLDILPRVAGRKPRSNRTTTSK